MKFFSASAFITALIASGSACIGGGGGQCCPPAQPECSNPCQGAGPQYAAAPPQYAAPPPLGGYPIAGK
uniref:Uncharacterized protein n=1 Tax=Caenorhabditis tropicalis TaxID=1561998 RepID=A0A1I7TK53_9PELO